MSLQDSLAYLQKTNSNGHNLYDHLSDVLLRLLENKPANAYDAFENISVDVKGATFNSPAIDHVKVAPDNIEAFESPENLALARVHVNLFKKER